MKLSEAEIFPTSDDYSWQYAVGKKNQQFLKNYKMSERFGKGKKNEQLTANFEKEILEKIYILVKSER